VQVCPTSWTLCFTTKTISRAIVSENFSASMIIKADLSCSDVTGPLTSLYGRLVTKNLKQGPGVEVAVLNKRSLMASTSDPLSLLPHSSRASRTITISPANRSERLLVRIAHKESKYSVRKPHSLGTPSRRIYQTHQK
jgi:hypothetical protein